MKIAILSDVHANLEALEQVLTDAQQFKIDQIVCLGDVVGYGPRPMETLARIRTQATLVLMGNHDAAVCGIRTADDFIDLAREAVLRHREALSEEDKTFLASCPYAASRGEAAFAHGDFTNPKAFNYIETVEDAKANFAATNQRLLFIGHSHTPELFICDAAGTLQKHPPRDLTLVEGARYIVNVGSVGYPRQANGHTFSSYVIYDTTAHTLQFRFLPFSVASILQRGAPKHRILPRICAALVLALIALLFYLLLPTRSETPQAPHDTTVAPKDDLLLETRQITVFPKALVHANLKVTDAPVELTLSFLDAHGCVLAKFERIIVKHVSTRGFPAPANATSARFELRKLQTTDTPHIRHFRPTISPPKST